MTISTIILNIDLMLAGHTHGTQFRVGPVSVAPLIYDEWAECIRKGGKAYISVSIGSVMIPFSFGVRPEITVITLKKEKI